MCNLRRLLRENAGLGPIALLCFVVAPLLSSCGQSDLYRKFALAAQKQDALKSNQLDLWARSPVIDGADPALIGSDNLDAIPRTPLVFEDITDLRAPIESESLKVYESSIAKRAPSFFSWAGQRVSHENPDFQIFMAYYHVTASMKYASSFINFGLDQLPLEVYAAQPGNALLSTSYLPSEHRIEFYKNDSPDLPYDPADESDAIHHEFGHFLQQSVNPDLLDQRVGVNPDIDILLEGLADAYSSAVVKDDFLLGYLTSNSKLLLESNNRLGGSKGLIRSPRNSLSFPSAYVDNINQDGRVISGALNDLRLYVSGQTIHLPNCSSNCDVKGDNNVIENDDAFNRVIALAYSALAPERFSVNSSTRGYVDNLYSGCSNAAWCQPHLAAFVRILRSRGLLGGNVLIDAGGGYPAPIANFAAATAGGAGNMPPATDEATPNSDPILYSKTTGFMPFPNDYGFANDDATLDPCELVLIYPDFKNNTSGVATSDFWHMRVELQSVENFDPVMIGGQPVDVLSGSNGDFPTKYLGWLKPGEHVRDLVNPASSRWYAEQEGSYFSKRLSRTNYPVRVGFLVHASSTPSEDAKATFKVFYSPYNSVVNENLSFTIQTSIPISANTNTPFCSRKPH